MIYLIYYKNFCKYHNVSPPSTTIKKNPIQKKVRKKSGGMCDMEVATASDASLERAALSGSSLR
jgi:hypothetical protein